MSYTDIFGSMPEPQRDIEETVTEPPVDAASATGDARQDDGGATLNFMGFTSPLPLLVEQPSVYVKRLRDAISSMVMPPAENDTHYGIDGRVLYSPAIALPFPVLYGDELFANEAVTAYPLLHQPLNHPMTETTPIRVYVLTLIAFYMRNGVIHEDGNGNLLAYGLTGQFNADDESWAEAERWANMMVEPLDALNRARLLGFALNDREHEMGTLATLFNAWDETRNGDDIIKAGQDAIPEVEAHYNDFIDVDFRPFNVR